MFEYFELNDIQDPLINRIVEVHLQGLTSFIEWKNLPFYSLKNLSERKINHRWMAIMVAQSYQRQKVYW